MSLHIAGKVVVITGAAAPGRSHGAPSCRTRASVVLGHGAWICSIPSPRQSRGRWQAAIAHTDVTVLPRQESDRHGLGRVRQGRRAINNAGLMAIAPMSALQVDEWNNMIDITSGVLNGIAAVLPHFQAQNSAISSISRRCRTKSLQPGRHRLQRNQVCRQRQFQEGLRHELAASGAPSHHHHLAGARGHAIERGSSHSESARPSRSSTRLPFPPCRCARHRVMRSSSRTTEHQ